jgi:hypothetical protein
MSLDPVVLFFALGLAAGLARADLRLPAPIHDALTFILLLAIGLKGGIELHEQASLAILGESLAVIAMGLVLPLLAFPLLLGPARLPRADAASVAAHYGSVSVGTYAVAVAFLTASGVSFDEYMALFVVLLEAPAIVVGILLARGLQAGTDWRTLTHELFLGRSVLLLLGGLLIGWIAGPVGIEPIAPLFFDAFKGVLALFLLDMGLIAASRMGALRHYGIALIAFGVLWPLFSAAVGTGLGLALGLSTGSIALLATLAASGSYIAVPAAMRIAVPEANPSLSLAASLGITFPFNIFVGIPLYLEVATRLTGGSP